MPIARTGPTKGDRTRSRILDALATLLEEAPYDQVSIAEVTRRAEVTRPAFYFHFDSLGAAISSLMEQLFDEFTKVAGDWYSHVGQDQPANLRAGMAQTVAIWRKHAVTMDAMMRAAAVDEPAARILDEWIAAFTSRALPVARADGRGLGDRADRVARLLVAMTFDAMRRDVRNLVATGVADPDVADTVAEVWIRTIYGSA
ncbi:MAG TPA: TetR/AcrR family transcriptional regulator [Nocardioides sp.]|nr:TetR/AcrR family transcriptional regulator [Nocardioides sp.]